MDCAARRLWRVRRDGLGAEGSLVGVLGIWIVMVWAFNVYRPSFAAVRYYFVFFPPVAILAARIFEEAGRGAGTWFRPVVAGGLVLSVGVALAVGLADKERAEVYRQYAARVGSELAGSGRPVYFVGHWGWQWYATRAGLVIVNIERPQLRRGDLCIIPRNVYRFPEGTRLNMHFIRARPDVAFGTRIPLRTGAIRIGASFHSTTPGTVPWRFSRSEPLDTFSVGRTARRGSGRGGESSLTIGL
jgi:hypothetical protein